MRNREVHPAGDVEQGRMPGSLPWLRLQGVSIIPDAFILSVRRGGGVWSEEGEPNGRWCPASRWQMANGEWLGDGVWTGVNWLVISPDEAYRLAARLRMAGGRGPG